MLPFEHAEVSFGRQVQDQSLRKGKEKDLLATEATSFPIKSIESFMHELCSDKSYMCSMVLYIINANIQTQKKNEIKLILIKYNFLFPVQKKYLKNFKNCLETTGVKQLEQNYLSHRKHKLLENSLLCGAAIMAMITEVSSPILTCHSHACPVPTIILILFLHFVLLSKDEGHRQ